jgi:hypothetical protein
MINEKKLVRVNAISYALVSVFGLLVLGWDWRPILWLFWLNTISAVLVGAVRAARISQKGSQLKAGFGIVREFTFPYLPVYGIFLLLPVYVFPLDEGYAAINGVMPALQLGQIFILWALQMAVEVTLACVRSNGERGDSERDVVETVGGRVGSTHLGIIAGYFLIIPFGGHLYAVAVGLIVINSLISYLSTLGKKKGRAKGRSLNNNKR